MIGISGKHGSELRFSRSLAAFLIGGIGLLVLVVVTSAIWISARHNELARQSSEQMVRSTFASIETKLRSLVRHDALWDEAYDAALAGDLDWLYSNVGTGAAQTGAVDLIVSVRPDGSELTSWRSGSPLEGEPGLLGDRLLADITGLLAGTDPESRPARSTYALHDGNVWAFAVAHVQPLGADTGLPWDALPMQIFGTRISPEFLANAGANTLINDLTVVDEVPPRHSFLDLRDAAGDVVRYVAWAPPRPGASILQQIALPLGIALLLVAGVATISSRFAVQSAARLERALVAAQAADRSKTEFLSNVSHELRTPMNGIIGVAQLLRLTELDQQQRELVEVLSASADTQMALISDLLDISRLEGGNRPLVNVAFQPSPIVGEVVELVRPLAAQKNLRLDCDIAALDGVALWGDARAFRQIVTNLVGNAVKFTDKGRISVVADLRREGERAEVVVRVVDTGRGIGAEDRKRIFERFYQVDGSHSRDAGGTGLGLAISRSLAGMMGGRIGVESVPGKGSTFTLAVTLPLAAVTTGLSDAA